MRLKKLGAALVVVAALGAVLASSALAAAVTQDVHWYTGAAPGTELSGSESVSAKKVSEKATFFTTVAGKEVILSAKKISCLGCTISNVANTGAEGTGQLVFEEVTVEKPEKCTTSSTITTNALTVQADWMIGEVNYIKFVPSAGEEKGFATFELTGAECALKTTIIPKGSVFVQSVNPTGTFEASQTVNSSKEINATAGGNLHVGTEAAWLEGSAAFELSGAKAGQPFATK